MSWNLALYARRVAELYPVLRALGEEIARTSALYRDADRLCLNLQVRHSVQSTLPKGVELASAVDTSGRVPVLASADRLLELGKKTLVMGVVNITPDSFSDGGRYLSPDAAHKHAALLLEQGVDILDLGAESTRPGATPLPAKEELARLLPVLQLLRSDSRFHSTWISIDTFKPEVAQAALKHGADMINDVSFGKCAVRESPYVLMHSRGTPQTMKQLTDYPQGVVPQVISEIREKLGKLRLWDFNVVLDPGIGFAKDAQQSWELVRSLGRLRSELNYPWLLGHSNKSFMRGLDLQTANLAVAGAGAQQGVAIVRVHSVGDTVHFLKAADRIWR